MSTTVIDRLPGRWSRQKPRPSAAARQGCARPTSSPKSTLKAPSGLAADRPRRSKFSLAGRRRRSADPSAPAAGVHTVGGSMLARRWQPPRWCPGAWLIPTCFRSH